MFATASIRQPPAQCLRLAHQCQRSFATSTRSFLSSSSIFQNTRTPFSKEALTSSSSSKLIYSTRNTHSWSRFNSQTRDQFRRRFSSYSGIQNGVIEQVPPAAKTFSYGKLAIAAGTIAGTVVLLDGFINRDQRASPLSAIQTSLLNSTYQHTLAGLTLTAISARGMFRSGVTRRMMMMNPWAVLGLGLVGGIGTMFATLYTDPEKNPTLKYGSFLAWNLSQAVILSPLYFFSPAILGRAALYTFGLVGSLSYIGATAKNEKFLWMGGPLLGGVTIVALSGLAPMVLPATAVRGMMISQNIWLYGGLAVFGGFVLFDTQKILKHGEQVERGLIKYDPVNESVGLILDCVNIFIRMVQILAMSGERRK